MMKKDCTLVVEVVDMLNENKIKIFHCFWSGEEGGGGGGVKWYGIWSRRNMGPQNNTYVPVRP